MKMDFLNAPENAWSAEQVYAQFGTQGNTRYFPVEDPKETTSEKMAGILDNRFDFLGEFHTLLPGFNWRSNPSRDLEWHIMLHKFYYAVGMGRFFRETGDQRYLDKWVALTESWIDAEIEPGFIASDVTGRRLQNWIFAHFHFVSKTSAPVLDSRFYAKFLKSIHAQASWLIDNLTPGRNHRTLELYAIFLTAVVFPHMKNAGDWLDFSRLELHKNLLNDFQQDGVHCEQSTDYHHIVLLNFLGVRKLASLNHIDMPDGFDQRLKAALEFAKYCHKPDGFIPTFSDGDGEDYRRVLQQGHELFDDPELLYVATRGKKGEAPRQRTRGFTASGYYIQRSGWGENGTSYRDEKFLMFDCGPLGRGNHGHFDLLNFEMYACGRSLIVDPGRYTYDETEATNWRVRFRGTGYHNTVMVDGKNQTRYTFDEKRRKFKITGQPPDFALQTYESLSGFDYLHGIARSQEYDAVHHRHVFFAAPDYWLIVDDLTADQKHAYDLLFHLAPFAQNATRVRCAESTLLVETPNLLLAQPVSDAIEARIEKGFVSQYYGVKHAAPIVRFAAQACHFRFYTAVFPFKHEQPRVSVAVMPALQNGKPRSDHDAGAAAVSVQWRGKRWTDYFFARRQREPEQFAFGDFITKNTHAFARVSAEGAPVRQHHCERVFSHDESVRSWRSSGARRSSGFSRSQA